MTTSSPSGPSTDTTLWALANGCPSDVQPALDELRLQADQALQVNWEHGRALHALIDAIAESPLTDEARTSFEAFADEYATGCPVLLQSFDDVLAGLEATIESSFNNVTNALQSEVFIAKDIERMKRDILNAVQLIRGHREEIVDLDKNLKLMSKDMRMKLEEL